jgi:hypothetical protein
MLGPKMLWLCGPMRSGSSILANLLRSHPGYVAGQANVHGENIPLMKLNRTLLQQFGGFADPNIPVHHSRCSGPNLGAMRAFLDEVRDSEYNWVLKDPRSCLTLGLWLGLMNPEEHHVIVLLRNPSSIRQSFQQTQPHNADEACIEIGRYYQMLFRGLANHDHANTTFFQFEKLMREPAATMAKLAYRLGIAPEFDLSLIEEHRWHFRPEEVRSDAVQERETEALDVREQAADGSGVGSEGEAQEAPEAP